MPRRPTIIVLSILAVALAAFIVVFWSKGEAGSTGEFCTAVRSGDNPLDVFDRYDPSNPETARQQLDLGVDRLRQLEDAAPNSIHDDMAVLVDVARKLADALDPANKDKPIPDLTSEFDKVGAASTEVTTFASASCGVDLVPPTSSS